MVKVSVLMPVYNLEDFIKHAMNSLFKQTLKDIEIVCVNDGSTDNSLEVLREFESKYDFIKVFSQENKGAGPALNKCIEEATGEYIAFLDADDIYVEDDALEKMYDYAVENDADMVAGNLKFVEQDYTVKDASHYKRKLYKLCTKKETFTPDTYGIPYAFYKNIFKREFLNEHDIRFPPYKRGVDTLFLARVLVNIKKIYAIPVWLYGYNHSIGGGFNKKLSDYDFIKNFFKVFKGVFDTFDEAGFDNANHEFKKELLLYLKNKENLKDYHIYELMIEVFGDDGYYFKGFCDDYNNIVAIHKLNHLNQNPSEEVYAQTKKDIYALKLSDNKKVSVDSLRRSFILLNSDSLEEYLGGFYKLENSNLKEKNRKLSRKNRDLKKKNKKLKRNLKKSKKLNDELLSSSSWKITKPIRKFKELFR